MCGWRSPQRRSKRPQTLRQKAPFGAFAWTDVRALKEGHTVELHFEAPTGEQAIVWLGEQSGRPVGG